MLKTIQETISNIDISNIYIHRKNILDELALYITDKLSKKEKVRLNFICTHNSRRSILSQVWGHTFAQYFHLKDIYCYSGGTESTTVPNNTLKILEKLGFLVLPIKEDIFAVKYNKNGTPVIIFSKTYNNKFNPTDNFIAIMTCEDADKACPVVYGAERRFSLPYKDPKQFDTLPNVLEKYQKISIQIATEIFYLFSKIKEANTP